MTVLALLLVHLAVFSACCEAYKILVVFPLPGPSHGILGNGIVKHLVNDGHEVTYISPFVYKPASPKVRMIDVSENLKTLPEDVLNVEAIMKKEVNMESNIFLLQIFMDLAEVTYANENVQSLINDPNEQFDLVIGEWMYNEIVAGLAAVFDCPFIWSSSVDVHWLMLRLIDGHSNPAYTRDVSTQNVPPFSFWQRATELFIQVQTMLVKGLYFDAMEKQVYENFIVPSIIKRGRQPPSYNDVKYNASLLLTNSHPSLSVVQSIPQNSIPIGGYHIETDVKPLPEDLKKILDNAKNGVIYFSLGSNVKSKHFRKELKESILNVFGGLKQTVLWKLEEDLPNRPKNVHILKWAPQQSILSHPNTLLFISHGGLLSITETIHFGKPIIGIPIFADQFANVEIAVHRGYGKRVDLSYTMANELKLAIEEMLRNSRYAEKAKELSLIYHDRSVPPGKAITHWVKHVVKTRGALHLRSPALNVPFYQKLYLDLLAVILVIIYISVILLKRVYKIFWAKSNVNYKKNN